MNVGKSTAAKALIYLNNKLAIQGKDTWLRINDGKPFTSGVYFGSSLVRTDGTLQVGDSGSALNVTTSAIQLKQPTTISSTLSVTGNSTLSTTSITTATVGQLNAQNANVYGTLRAASYSIESVQNLGGHFLVCPTIEVPSAASGFSAQVTQTSSTQIRIAFTDNSLSTDTFNGTTWTQKSKVKISGMINNIALGTCDGVIESWNKFSKVVTVLVTCGVATSFSTTATTYTSSQVSDLSIMMYELCPNPSTSDTTYRIGVYLTAYGENKYSYVDIYDGTSVNPNTRMGKLDGLPNVNNTAPTGWGFYSAENGYFSGTVVSSAGHIGGFYLGETAIYSTTNALGTTANNVYLGSEGISLGTTFKVTKAGELTANSGNIGGSVKIGGTKTASTVLSDITDAATKATNYITDISNDGIWVTPSDAKPVNGAATSSTSGWHISDVIELFKSGVSYIKAYVENSIAKVRIGRPDQGHLILDNDSLDVSDGSEVVATFGGSGSRIGRTGGAHSIIDTDGQRFYASDGTTELAKFTTSGVYLGEDDAVVVRPTGVTKRVLEDEFIGNFSFPATIDLSASAVYSILPDAQTFHLRFKVSGGEIDMLFTKGVAHTHENVGVFDGEYDGESNIIVTSHATLYTEGDFFIYVQIKKQGGVFSFGHRGVSDDVGFFSATFGEGLLASGDEQTVFGHYNEDDPTKAVIIGNGTETSSSINRSNALTVDWNGNVEASGGFSSPTKTLSFTSQYVENIFVERWGKVVSVTLNNMKSVPNGQSITLFTLPEGWRPRHACAWLLREPRDTYLMRAFVQVNGDVTVYNYGSSTTSASTNATQTCTFIVA